MRPRRYVAVCIVLEHINREHVLRRHALFFVGLLGVAFYIGHAVHVLSTCSMSPEEDIIWSLLVFLELLYCTGHTIPDWFCSLVRTLQRYMYKEAEVSYLEVAG